MFLHGNGSKGVNPVWNRLSALPFPFTASPLLLLTMLE